MGLVSASALLEGECFVVFLFPDGSRKLIRTSRNPDIVGDKIKEGYLYDLDDYRFVSLERFAGATLEIHDTRPEMREVDLFANKFIF